VQSKGKNKQTNFKVSTLLARICSSAEKKAPTGVQHRQN
jgi:hypothetical protein